MNGTIPAQIELEGILILMCCTFSLVHNWKDFLSKREFKHAKLPNCS